MKYQPKQINKAIQKLNEAYEAQLEKLAEEIMENKIKPMLIKRGLGFTVMNGFPQVYDKDGNRKTTPIEIVNLFEKTFDIEGNCLGYKLPDFNPFEQDFGDLDIKHFEKRTANITENQAALSCMMVWRF